MVTPQEQEAASRAGGRVNNEEAVKVEDRLVKAAKVEDRLVEAARLVGDCSGEWSLDVFEDSPRLFP